MGGQIWLGPSVFRRRSVWASAPADVAAAGDSAEDAVVLMTHSYEQDRELVAALLSAAEISGAAGSAASEFAAGERGGGEAWVERRGVL